MDTIGTTRGFGDHDLRVAFCSLPIKPFLTPQPEVSVLRLLIHLNWYGSHQIGAVVTDMRVIMVTAWWNEVCKINSNSFLYRNPLGQRRCKRKYHNWLSKSKNLAKRVGAREAWSKISTMVRHFGVKDRNYWRTLYYLDVLLLDKEMAVFDKLDGHRKISFMPHSGLIVERKPLYRYMCLFSYSSQVRKFDLSSCKLTEDDVVIMASDGLWERLSSEKVMKLALYFFC